MSRRKWKTELAGITYRSGFEARVAKHLISKKIEFEYEIDKLKYEIPASKHTYTPDITLPNGVLIEVKGRFTPADRKKMSLVKEQNPDREICLLFMVNNTLSKASKTRYSDWSEKRGFKWHVSPQGEVPTEWYKKIRRGKLDD